MTVNTPPSATVESALAAYQDVSLRLRSAYEGLMHEVGRLSAELHQKNRELARRERLASLGQLAAGLAHEIRNPLGGIALYATMLERDVADRPDAREVVRKVIRGVRSLDRLVGEILEFAQEDVIECGWTTLGEVLEPALDAARGWIGGRAIELSVEPGSAGLRLRCDGARLERAFSNVLINAVQAIGERGAVRVAASGDATGGVEVEIVDSGPGIPDDRLERIFDPFFTTRAGGTGLGLAIVHRIIEAHGGTVRVANRPSGGAAFTIRLPGPPAAGEQVPGVAERTPSVRRESWNRMAS